MLLVVSAGQGATYESECATAQGQWAPREPRDAPAHSPDCLLSAPGATTENRETIIIKKIIIKLHLLQGNTAGAPEVPGASGTCHCVLKNTGVAPNSLPGRAVGPCVGGEEGALGALGSWFLLSQTSPAPEQAAGLPGTPGKLGSGFSDSMSLTRVLHPHGAPHGSEDARACVEGAFLGSGTQNQGLPNK